MKKKKKVNKKKKVSKKTLTKKKPIKKKINKKKISKKKKKKVAKKTTKKKKVSKRKPKQKELTPEEIKNNKFIELTCAVKKFSGSNTEKSNEAFNSIYKMIEKRILNIVNKFNIPGYDRNDILQEALYALRYKAIQDYDKSRGNGEGFAFFDRFACLCIRRHLATEFKTSYQAKRKVLNQSLSLNQDNSDNDGNGDNNLHLSNIIKSDDDNVLNSIQKKEYYNFLMSNLIKELSSFEQEVFFLYAQKYSYEEIANKINDKNGEIVTNVKSIDNALSRIKNKAQFIHIKYVKLNEEES